MNYAHVTYPPVFSTPLRWALRVLAWLAFGVSAYLAWHAVNQSSVAGCGIGDDNSCNIVLGSSWSKWFDVPVAVVGLACYATLAGLSVLLELRNATLGRWINTAFVMLSVLAAAASLWFIGLQIFAIGHYCIFCLIADICGISLGAIAVWAAASWLHETRYIRKPRVAAAGLMALRSAMPAAGRGSPMTSSNPAAFPTPSLPLALSGALAALAVLVTVQLVFPAKTHTLQEGSLDAPIALVGANDAKRNQADPTSDSQPHIAMRIPSIGEDDELEGDVPPGNSASSEPTTPNEEEDSEVDHTANGNSQAAAEPPTNGSNGTSPSAAEPERLVKFLGGKLTLDVYKHPLIGSPNAPHVMVEMISYDCPHCRKMHGIMKKGLARYGDELAIIVMPIPFEKGCN
ncbi:MAG TPA: vitamin K epoxide reductase family protein, partial [Lacipirellulaceae bacterium]|nr:vitamin K epoxide reductase family protein [Lacipirellulaceae bacterium]